MSTIDQHAYDFGKGPVPAHRHQNPDGTIGGWVANTASVSTSVYVGERAKIAGGTFWGGEFVGGEFVGGTFWGGEFRGGEFWGGEFWGGKFLAGVFLRGEFRGGEFWGGTFRGGTFLGGTFFGGKFLDGTFWLGTFLGGALVSDTPAIAIRSDGYVFALVPQSEGPPHVTAGCRDFTLADAREHWTKTRGGTRLGDETMAILDFFERKMEIMSREY